MSKKHEERDEALEIENPAAPAPEEAGGSEGETSTSPESAATDREESSHPEKGARRKLKRSEVLSRMAAKNQRIDELMKENRRLEEGLRETRDQLLRTAAEFENYRRRTSKEWELLQQQTKAEVILEILSIVDDFERAFAAAEGEESSGFVEGFRLIYNNLTQTLERIGVSELDALHQPFDPNYHMAVGQIERDDLDGGVVAEVLQKGYLLNDSVVRPANVIVAK